jgi:hypothetical protein
MAKTNTPIYLQTGTAVANGFARMVAANTASDGTGTVYTVYTAGANDSVIYSLSFINSQATAAASGAKVFRWFTYDGTTYNLIGEVAQAAATRSTTAIGAATVYTFPNGGLWLKTGYTLVACMSVYAGAQDQTDVHAYGADY